MRGDLSLIWLEVGPTRPECVSGHILISWYTLASSPNFVRTS
jgi:hypothetical protein